MPRTIRKVSHEVLDVRAWDVEMAYLTIDAQVADKLRIQINIPYFSMETIKLYIKDNRTIWESTNEMRDVSNNERNRICNEVLNIEAIEARYVDNVYLRNFPRRGRATRWLSFPMTPGLYERLTSDGEKNGQALAHIPIFSLASYR